MCKIRARALLTVFSLHAIARRLSLDFVRLISGEEVDDNGSVRCV